MTAEQNALYRKFTDNPNFSSTQLHQIELAIEHNLSDSEIYHVANTKYSAAQMRLFRLFCEKKMTPADVFALKIGQIISLNMSPSTVADFESDEDISEYIDKNMTLAYNNFPIDFFDTCNALDLSNEELHTLVNDYDKQSSSDLNL